MAAPTEKTNVVTAIVFDFETGGTDCTKDGAVQISMHAVRLDTFEVMEKLNLYIQPYNKQADAGKPKRKVLRPKDANDEENELMNYGAAAEKVHGITMSMMRKLGLPLREVCEKIIDFISRNTFDVKKSNLPFFIGQNPLFDEGFLEQIFIYTGLWKELCKIVRTNKDFWGNDHLTILDTIVLSQLVFDNDPSVTSWKLELMAERLGIDLDDAHDADADVVATREIVRVLTARMRQNDGNSNDVGGLVAEKREKLRDHFKI